MEAEMIIKIKHKYLKNTTIITHLGAIVLDKEGAAEIQTDNAEFQHPDIEVIGAKNMPEVKAEVTEETEIKEEANELRPAEQRQTGSNRRASSSTRRNVQAQETSNN